MRIHTPQDVAQGTTSKYVGCVIAAKYARRLHEQQRDTTQFLEKKPTSEALERLTSGELNYEIVDRKLGRKKPKSLFSTEG